MRTWLASWIRRLLLRLAAWLSDGEMRPPVLSAASEGPPAHWIRRAAPPPPAHWLARVRGAVPLESVEPAFPPPAPAGDHPQTVVPAPQRRRADPALLAPKRPSSPDAPPAGKGGSSLLPKAAWPVSERARQVPEGTPPSPERRARVVTRIEEAVPLRVPRSSEAPALGSAQKLPDSFCGTPQKLSGSFYSAPPSARRVFDIVEESQPAEPGRVPPPAPRLPEGAPRPSIELPAPVTKQTVRFVTPVTKQTVRFVTPVTKQTVRFVTPQGPPVQDSRGGGFLSLPWEAEATRDAEAIPQPGAWMASGPGMASRWPELAARPPEDDEPWRAAGVDAERRRRLDLEQRGKPWSE
jgi:hypothetical protein